MPMVDLGSIQARIALLVTRGYGRRARGQGKLTMAFPGATSTDLDPCPLHTERLGFDVGGARYRYFTYVFALLKYHLMFFSGRQKYIHTYFGAKMSQMSH